VLLQEISRYDKLLTVMHEQFEQLVNGLKGAVVISSDMEEVVASMYAGKVPEAWSFAYPSTKTLGPWARELTARIQQLRKWADDGVAPKVFWLGGFTFPTGFLTALFQHYARKNGVGIDDLSWDFQPQSTTESNINNAPKEGAYIKGLYLEGARWEMDNQTLAEAYPTELTSPMPIVYFKPVHQSKRSGKGLHKTPLFIYPVREGTISRASFMLEVELKTGAHESAYWTRRGVALLLTLGDSG
jgi:dynein heavy chain